MHCILDAYFRELRECGVGAEMKKTSLVTKEEEDALWEKCSLGVDTQECFLRAIFCFAMAKYFVFVGASRTVPLKYLK
jgi:hypothetical protein